MCLPRAVSLPSGWQVGKVFPHLRMERARRGSDGTTNDTPPPEPVPRPDERARAQAYLDRWERQLADLARDGPARPGRRPPA